jgi:hypothetical protein
MRLLAFREAHHPDHPLPSAFSKLGDALVGHQEHIPPWHPHLYCSQPVGFVDSTHLAMVCKLNRSFYGIKQAPSAWYSRFAFYLVSLGFVEAKSNMFLFVLRHGTDTVYLLLYIDAIVLMASSPVLLYRTIASLQQDFAMKALGPLHHFLGVTVERRP